MIAMTQRFTTWGHLWVGLVIAAAVLCPVLSDAQAWAPGSPAPMEWVNLNGQDTRAQLLHSFWSDKLSASLLRWHEMTPDRPLPAWSLTQTLTSAAGEAVVISFLFDFFDCDIPGPGRNTNLYAQCPLRIITGKPGVARVMRVPQACMIHVDEPDQPGQGPDPARNFTTVSLDTAGALRLRVYQYGRLISSCNTDLKVR